MVNVLLESIDLNMLALCWYNMLAYSCANKFDKLMYQLINSGAKLMGIWNCDSEQITLLDNFYWACMFVFYTFALTSVLSYYEKVCTIAIRTIF